MLIWVNCPLSRRPGQRTEAHALHVRMPWRFRGNDVECCLRYYVANAAWLACIANHTVIPAKAGTQAAWVPAFAGMTVWLAMHASHAAFAS